MSPATILGHESQRRALAAAADADRLPHALLFTGPDGVGKRTVALELARRLVAGDDPEAGARFDRGAHERFLLYSDLEKPLPVRRGDLLDEARDEAALREAYGALVDAGWIDGISPASGPDVVDLVRRDPERFVGRRGIPFADVLEKELAGLEKSKGAGPAAVAVARRLFSVGLSHAPYRRNLGIELINGRGDGAHFRTVDALLGTARAGWRVAVLDDAHRMTEAAENAFLKTLEEPPPRTLLVLVTSEPLSLLSTTVSRCARVPFDALPRVTLADHLVRTQGVGEDEAALVAALAEGSPGKALELLGQDFGERRDAVGDLVDAIAAGDLRRALALAGRRLAAAHAGEGGRGGARDRERREATRLLDLLALVARDVVVTGAAEIAPASGLDPARVRACATRLPAGAWEALFDRVALAAGDVAANVEPRLALEALLADTIPALPFGAVA